VERLRTFDDDLVFSGITAGVIAGAVMLAAEMASTIVLGGSLESPLRLAASVVLGPAALSFAYPFTSAAIVGGGVQVILASVYGVLFVAVLTRANRWDAGARLLLPYGVAFGALIWVLNYLILGETIFPQFAVVEHLWNGIIAHAVCFGFVLGAACLSGRG